MSNSAKHVSVMVKNVAVSSCWLCLCGLTVRQVIRDYNLHNYTHLNTPDNTILYTIVRTVGPLINIHKQET